MEIIMEGYHGSGPDQVDDDTPAALVQLRKQRASLEDVARKKERANRHKEEMERLRREIRELGFAPRA